PGMSEATCPECKGNPRGVLLLDHYSPCSLCAVQAEDEAINVYEYEAGGPTPIVTEDGEVWMPANGPRTVSIAAGGASPTTLDQLSAILKQLYTPQMWIP